MGKETAAILRKICLKDHHNTEVLKSFIAEYGDFGIKRELVKYPDLLNIIKQ